MKTFNSIEECAPYYNQKTNTYEFVENGQLMNVKFAFDFLTAGNLNAGGIEALNINAGDINAWDIRAVDINAWDINAGDINAWNIRARDINARDINAWNINAGNINALDIDAIDIKAWNIWALNINARDINYYAVCWAYRNINCTSIKGRRENAKHFCLDGEITIQK